MAFPADRLGLTVELALNANLAAPTTWLWFDVTDRLLAQSIGIHRGRPDEAAEPRPASVSMTLDNGDGQLTPDNPASPWWPYVRRGTPLRVRAEGGTPALLLDGDGWAETPDHADFDVADLDIRVRCQPDSWSSGVVWVDGARTFSSPQYLASRFVTTGNQRVWLAGFAGAGWPNMSWRTDGTAGIDRYFDGPLLAALRPIWVGYTLDTDNGAGGFTATVWRWDGATPPDDITEWTVVDTRTTTGSTSLFASSTAPLMVGGFNGAGGFTGRILAAEFRDAINGTVVANPDFTAAEPGDTTVTDSTGKVWTLGGGAAISTMRARFVGTVDSIDPYWPHGDNNPTGGGHPSECRVDIVASDVLRRLSQGAKPLRSALTRAVTGTRRVGNVTAYWPCEDTSGAVHLAAGLTTHGLMTITGVSAGSDSTLPAAGALPTVADGDPATWSAAVPAGPSDAWGVNMVLRIPTPPATPATTRVLTVLSEGTVREWRLSVSSTTTVLQGLNGDGGTVFSNSTATTHVTGWMLVQLNAAQDGANIDWAWSFVYLDAGTSGGVSDSVAGTLGRVTNIANTTTGPTGGMSFGHIIVHDGRAVGWLAPADTAYVGESAAHRIWRLCTEEGIPVEVVGDPSVYSDFRGDLGLSEAMGTQGQQTLLRLLADCAGTDLGIMAPRRAAPGLVYRTRQTLEAQDVVALELDAAAEAITNPMRPRYDDQRLRNDVTVTSAGGSSARVVDATSVAEQGLYEDEATIAGVGGVPIQNAIVVAQAGLSGAQSDQNAQQAAWRVHLGTWPGMRYPAVTVDLGKAPALIPALHDLELGDRVTLEGLPAQHPAAPVELLVEAIDERLSPVHWLADLTCSPGGPWQVGTLDA